MSKNNQNLSQPKALLPLAGTELWERVGFYTVQGMLIFLLTSYFKMADQQADYIFGIFGAMVFITPIIGGYFADKILGFRWTILMGAVFMCIGYLMIATLDLDLVYWGLSSVILGNGFLKPNLASYLGVFYTQEDLRRQSGFTYYYMVANIGSFIATMIAGYIQSTFTWHIVFLVPAVGIGVGILTFLLGIPTYQNKGLPVAIQFIREKTIWFVSSTAALWLVISGITYALLRNAKHGDSIVIIIGALTLGYLLYLASRYHKAKRQHFFALIILIVFSVVFWAIFFEMFSAVGLFTERSVDRHLFGHTIPPIVFASLEPLFILLVGAPFAALWKYLNRIKKNPNIALKFGLALLLMALAMWVLRYSLEHTNLANLVYPAWLALFYFLITTGEMLLSPNLISAVTELSPKEVVGMMMGVQYMAIGFGSAITGRLAQFAAVPKSVTTIIDVNAIYYHAFTLYALIALGAGVLIMLLSPWIYHLIRAKDIQT